MKIPHIFVYKTSLILPILAPSRKFKCAAMRRIPRFYRKRCAKNPACRWAYKMQRCSIDFFPAAIPKQVKNLVTTNDSKSRHANPKTLHSKGVMDYNANLSRGVAQPGRALRSGRRGRRFESSRPDHFPSKTPHRAPQKARFLPFLGKKLDIITKPL
jgi:hypothetical protein